MNSFDASGLFKKRTPPEEQPPAKVPLTTTPPVAVKSKPKKTVVPVHTEQKIDGEIKKATAHYKKNPKLLDSLYSLAQDIHLEDGLGLSKALGMTRVPQKTEKDKSIPAMRCVKRAYSLLEADAIPPVSVMNKVVRFTRDMMQA